MLVDGVSEGRAGRRWEAQGTEEMVLGVLEGPRWTGKPDCGSIRGRDVDEG